LEKLQAMKQAYLLKKYLNLVILAIRITALIYQCYEQR
jgi:hypothetical protein